MNLQIIHDPVQITQLLEHRPEPCYEHITTQSAARTWKTLTSNKDLYFLNKRSTFGNKPLTIGLDGTDEVTSSFEHKGVRIPATLDAASVSNYNIALSHEKVKVRIIEHIMGVLTATNHVANISLLGGNNRPTEATCVEEYYNAIMQHSIDTDIPIQYVTPSNPIFVRGKGGSYVGFLPAKNNDRTLTIDLMVAYPGNGIGTQRILVDIDDEFAAKIVGARAPSYGWRGALMPLINKIPGIKNVVSVNPDAVLHILLDGSVNNPRMDEKYLSLGDHDAQYLELVYHEVLDDLGALALLGKGRKLAGTFVSYKGTHALDLACMKQLEKEGLLNL